MLPGGLSLCKARQVLPNAELCLSGVPEQIESQAGIVVFIDQVSDGQRLLKTLQAWPQQVLMICAACA